MIKYKAQMDVRELSDEVRDALEGWRMDRHDIGFGFSKGSWIDWRHSEMCDEEGKDVAKATDFNALFLEFMRSLGLQEEDLQKLLSHWEEDIEFVVEWE